MKPVLTEVSQTQDYYTILHMLAKKRVDTIPAVELTTDLHIRTVDVGSKIIKTDAVLSTQDMYLLISKKSKHRNIMSKYEEAFEKLSKDGTLDKIRKKYIN